MARTRGKKTVRFSDDSDAQSIVSVRRYDASAQSACDESDGRPESHRSALEQHDTSGHCSQRNHHQSIQRFPRSVSSRPSPNTNGRSSTSPLLRDNSRPLTIRSEPIPPIEELTSPFGYGTMAKPSSDQVAIRYTRSTLDG